MSGSRLSNLTRSAASHRRELSHYSIWKRRMRSRLEWQPGQMERSGSHRKPIKSGTSMYRPSVLSDDRDLDIFWTISQRFAIARRRSSRWSGFGDLKSSTLERFPAKWKWVRVKKKRQNKNLELRSDSIGTEKAPVKSTMRGVWLHNVFRLRDNAKP